MTAISNVKVSKHIRYLSHINDDICYVTWQLDEAAGVENEVLSRGAVERGNTSNVTNHSSNATRLRTHVTRQILRVTHTPAAPETQATLLLACIALLLLLGTTHPLQNRYQHHHHSHHSDVSRHFSILQRVAAGEAEGGAAEGEAAAASFEQ